MHKVAAPLRPLHRQVLLKNHCPLVSPTDSLQTARPQAWLWVSRPCQASSEPPSLCSNRLPSLCGRCWLYPYWEVREPSKKHTFPHLSPKHLKTHRGQADGRQDTPGKGWAGRWLGCGAPVGGQKGMASWSQPFRGVPEGAWGLSDDGAQRRPAGFTFPCRTREAHMCWGCTPLLRLPHTRC